MTPNENVYGARADWVASQFNIGDVYFPSWEKLRNGVSAGKIDLGEPLDKSLGYVGLGTESPYSSIISVDKDGHFVIDERPVTNFFLSYGDLSQRYYLANNTNALTWDVDNLDGIPVNYNGDLRPIICFNPSKILWWVLITAASVPDPEYDYQVIGVRLYQYHNNVNNWRNDYPYVKAVYMVPAFDVSDTETPDRLTTGNSINLSINDRRNIYNKIDFLTFTDLSLVPIPAILTAHTTRQGILLRGGREGLGDNWCFDNYCIYFLGDRNSVISSEITHYTYAEEYSDSVRDEILKAAACFCMPFVADIELPNEYTINNVPLTDNCVYWGYPDENGISHGEYTRGADNPNNPVADWDDTTDSNYDYQEIPIDYDKTHFGTAFVSSAFTKHYALDLVGVGQLSNKLFTFLENRDPNIPIDVFLHDNFLTTNPLDLVVSLKKMPFNVSDIINMSSDTVTIGKMTTTINCKSTTGAVMRILDFGSIQVPAYYGDFRDYEPYTTYEMIIPFCGSVKLNAVEIVGKQLTLKMALDPFTGDCTCYFLVEGKIIDSVSGNCAIDLPIAGEQSATITNSIANARTNVYNAKLSSRQNTQSAQYQIFSTLGNSALSMFGSGKNPTKVASYTGVGSALISAGGTALNAYHDAQRAGVDIGKAEYDLSHGVIPVKSIGGQSALTNTLQPMTSDLLIERCKMFEYDPTTYAKTVGYACLMSGTVSDFDGFTVGTICLDNVNCTSVEKAMIKQAFASGVYL